MHAALVGLALALPLPRLDPQGGATWRHPGQVEVDRAIERGAAFLRAGWEASTPTVCGAARRAESAAAASTRSTVARVDLGEIELALASE